MYNVRLAQIPVKKHSVSHLMLVFPFFSTVSLVISCMIERTVVNITLSHRADRQEKIALNATFE